MGDTAMDNINIQINVQMYLAIGVYILLSGHASLEGLCQKKIDGNNVIFCCTYYYPKNGECLECPNGTETDPNKLNASCLRCEKSWYGYHCSQKCTCLEHESCHHEFGCIVPVVINTTDRTTMKGPDVGEKTMYYVALGCVFVMAILIGMMLKGVHNKYCSKRKSAMSVSIELDEPRASENRIASGVLSPYHVYDYIDELQMVENDAKIKCPAALNKMCKRTEHLQKLQTKSEKSDVDEGQKNDNDGYLHPYQPIHATAVDVHTYKSLNIQQNPQIHNDDYLHPYNSLVEQTVDVHAYKTLNAQHNPSVHKDDYLHPYNSLVKQTEKDIHKYSECMTLESIVS